MGALQSYNGWPGPVRASRLAELNAMRRWRADELPLQLRRAYPCEICGQRRNTMLHAEQYGPTFDDYLAALHWLCGHCHAMLHLRFRFPNRWRQHLLAASLGPVPFVSSMGEVFRLARGITDLPVVCYEPGPEWFHQLAVTR